MTKEISKKICELAGIEARYICSAKTEQEMQCMICRDFNSKPEIPCYGCRMSIETYPNFETPENFVKLLKVYLNTSNDYISFDTGFGKFECTAGGYTDKYGELFGEVMNDSESLEEATILTIIGYLKKEKTNKLKQALQATEWVY